MMHMCMALLMPAQFGSRALSQRQIGGKTERQETRERERERDEMARTLPGLSLSMIGDIEEEEICNIAEESGDKSETMDEVSFQSYEEEKAEDE